MKLLKNDLDSSVHTLYMVGKKKKTLHNPVGDSPTLYGTLLSLFQEKCGVSMPLASPLAK